MKNEKRARTEVVTNYPRVILFSCKILGSGIEIIFRGFHYSPTVESEPLQVILAGMIVDTV